MLLQQLRKYGVKQIIQNYLLPHRSPLIRNHTNPAAKQQFLNGTSAAYVEDMYKAWLRDPSSVHASWDSYFRNSAQDGAGYQAPPSLAVPAKNEVRISSVLPSITSKEKNVAETFELQTIIRSYQVRGHLVANLDPLGITHPDRLSTITERKGTPPKEVLREVAFSEADLDRVFTLPPITFIGGNDKALPLREILRRLELTYCQHIGVEYMFIDDIKRCVWIRRRIESPGSMQITKEDQKRLLHRLIRSHGFEAFLAKKYASEKRFGLEGCEVLIPCLKEIIDTSSVNGVETVMFALAHRGRLNMLANVCRKPLYQIFTQFIALEATDEGSGDVKYHLGTMTTRLNRKTNKNIKLVLISNPSHLESVDSCLQGMVRAEQFYKGDTEGKKVMPVLIHGDAAFCGQGIVFETMHLSELPEYTTHGSIHIVVNNQIGFTTDPRFSRSSRYCTDVAKMINAPIFHVNADDPESVMHISKLAADWRAKFHKDVVIDLVCYRRNGHNEGDEPMFTQPLMYTKIRKKKPVMFLYSEHLTKQGVVTAEEVQKTIQEYEQICEDDFQKAAKETQIKFKDWLDCPWPGFFKNKNPLKVGETGVKENILTHIGKKFASPPPKPFVIHKGLERILKARMEMVEKRIIDWSLGEAMAYGSLLKEGIHVRLSGQDVERGTFSHRHHVMHHQTIDKATYRPLCNLWPDQAPYKVSNSSLAENAVLGFETGYATVNPNALVMWEAQFGDFANTAQAFIDTVVCAGQSKWVRQNGVVMQLPHGLEGQGPEHSSGRIERCLQLCADDPDHVPPPSNDFSVLQLREINWIVANCTTPANLFHILRRQIKLPFRKPLVLFTPKSLLRHPEARSSFDELLEGTEFKRVIPESGLASKNPSAVKKVVFCCGKVYYEFKKNREEAKLDETIAIIRVEQIAPFPFDLLKVECDKYSQAKLFWGQEEHKNSGCWGYVEPRFRAMLTGTNKEVKYIGRAPSAAPATGSKNQYIKELMQLKQNFLNVN